MKLRGEEIRIDTLLNAMAVDALNWLVWSRTVDGSKNRNKPESMVQKLTEPKKEPEVESFNSGEEFERARALIINE